jgi:hypothetical protein
MHTVAEYMHFLSKIWHWIFARQSDALVTHDAHDDAGNGVYNFSRVFTTASMTGGGFKIEAISMMRPVWGFTHPWPKFNRGGVLTAENWPVARRVIIENKDDANAHDGNAMLNLNCGQLAHKILQSASICLSSVGFIKFSAAYGAVVSVLAFIESHVADIPELMRQMLDAADIRPSNRGRVGEKMLLPCFAQALKHSLDAGDMIDVDSGCLLFPFHSFLPL